MTKKIGLLLFLITFMLTFVTPVFADQITLSGIVRDFKYYSTTDHTTNPDFQNYLGDDKGIVQTNLGADGKPVYAGQAGNPSTHGPTYFSQWYNNATNNIAIPYSITLTEKSPGIYQYSSSAFFPIDGQGFGNQGSAHNYSFTYELHTTFTYQPGQVFSFTGDDDVFVFINDKLVIDLGGVHPAENATVNLDTLGLTAGKTYGFDFFFAERHTTESNLKIETSIPLKPTPTPIPAAVWLLGTGLMGLVGVKRRLTK